MTATCLFCRIVRGDLPATKVAESDDAIAFKDLNPQAPVHVLVIPKEAAETVLDLSPDGGAAMMATTQKVAKAVKKALDAPGINCSSCKAPADEYKLTKIEPTVKP